MTNVSLVAKRGDNESYTMALTDADGAFDLTDCQVQFTAKRRLDDEDADAVILKTLDAGIEVTNAQGGIAVLSLEPSDTEDLPSRRVRLVYDVQVTNGDGEVKTPIEGRLTISPDVTTGPGS